MKDGLAVLSLSAFTKCFCFAVGPDKYVSMAARGACVAQFLGYKLQLVCTRGNLLIKPRYDDSSLRASA